VSDCDSSILQLDAPHSAFVLRLGESQCASVEISLIVHSSSRVQHGLWINSRQGIACCILLAFSDIGQR
jgi:hypothetical protein